MTIVRAPASRVALAGALALLAWMGSSPSLAADPAATPGVRSATSQPAGIVIEGRSGSPFVATPQEISALAQTAASLPVEHGGRQARYEGPLLWSLLQHAGAIDASKPRDQVRQTVLIAGRDGYTAVLALAEISPEFAAKQVILADRMDGEPLGPEHLRLVVPGERRGGRSVRDVVRISVGPATPAAR